MSIKSFTSGTCLSNTICKNHKTHLSMIEVSDIDLVNSLLITSQMNLLNVDYMTVILIVKYSGK